MCIALAYNIEPISLGTLEHASFCFIVRLVIEQDAVDKGWNHRKHHDQV